MKYDEKALTVMVWRSKDLAVNFMDVSNLSPSEYKIKEFTLDVFDRIDRWAESLGMNLFIHVISSTKSKA